MEDWVWNQWPTSEGQLLDFAVGKRSVAQEPSDDRAQQTQQVRYRTEETRNSVGMIYDGRICITCSSDSSKLSWIVGMSSHGKCRSTMSWNGDNPPLEFLLGVVRFTEITFYLGTGCL